MESIPASNADACGMLPRQRVMLSAATLFGLDSQSWLAKVF